MADERNSTSELGQAIQEVSEKASLLVREEIELAKAEVTEKVTKLIKGAVVGIVAGVFAVFALVYLLHSLSWGVFAIFSDDANYIWIGYLIVGGLLMLLGGLGGFLAARFIKGGAPPTPVMAIEEGKLIKETVQSARPAQPHDSDVKPAETTGAGAALMAETRSPEDIRRSIEANRAELGLAVEKLRGEVAEVADWRRHLRNNQKQVLIGAAVAGFVLGGGVAAMTGLLTRRRSRDRF